MRYDTSYRRGTPRLPSTSMAPIEGYLRRLPKEGATVKAFRDVVKILGVPLTEGKTYLETCMMLGLVVKEKSRLFWCGQTPKK